MEESDKSKPSEDTEESTTSDNASSKEYRYVSLGCQEERQRALKIVNRAIVSYIERVAKMRESQAVDAIQSDLEKTRLEKD